MLQRCVGVAECSGGLWKDWGVLQECLECCRRLGSVARVSRVFHRGLGSVAKVCRCCRVLWGLWEDWKVLQECVGQGGGLPKILIHSFIKNLGET